MNLNKKLYLTESPAALPQRSEIKGEYKWDLTDIYPTDDDWEKDFKWIEKKLVKYKSFEGTFHKNPEKLLECLKFDDKIGRKLERLYLYAMLSKDSDMRITKYQGMDDRIKSLYTAVSTANAFIRPELLSISNNKLLSMINSSKGLKVYRHFIEDLIRTKAHTLKKGQEEILALAAEPNLTSYSAYSMFTNADIKFPSVEDDNGNEIEMSHARFYAAMYSKDREYRQRAFKSYLSPYIQYINTFSALFNGNLKSNIFNAKARKYKSALEASLDKNFISVSVYDNLIEATNNNLQPLHRWGKLKKKLLNLDALHPYDVYVTLFSKETQKTYQYETAMRIVLEALKPMGEDYIASLKKAFDNRWIDVYETHAKRSGAYSSGTTFGVHPYVLLNWTNLLNDVFTLAHEMGHNMHSYYTGKSQPFPYANYSIFLAEVASTFNEALLLNYLINNSSTKEDKLFFLEKYLNNITATFYRQIMFAEFEKVVYEKVESGKALTPDVLSEIYSGIYKKYWGPAMEVDNEERFTWARIPHFYYNFYVFQYATGFAASEVLSSKVLNDGKKATENYLNFLKAGSSDYPINILKNAGVDMNSPEPILSTTKKMNNLLDEVENLL